MSIIYDALKKVEESNNVSSTVKINKKIDAPKHKIYLVYILVVCLGVFIASIFFGLFAKPYQINTKVVAKNVPQVQKLQDANLYHELPKEVSPFETNLPVPSENQNQPRISWVLNGVFFSQDEGYALINNQIVKQGDIIEGATVVRITLDDVELEAEGSTIKLTTPK